MSRFEQADSRESHGNLQADAAEGGRAALAADCFAPVPGATGCADRNSAALQGFPMEGNLISEGITVIKLPRGKVDEGATFHERVAKPGNGPRPGAYDPDAGQYGGLEASADTPNPPVRTLSESEMRRARERMQPIPGESQADLLWRLQKA